jgi:ABC-type transport system substrate-binding protein
MIRSCLQSSLIKIGEQRGSQPPLVSRNRVATLFFLLSATVPFLCTGCADPASRESGTGKTGHFPMRSEGPKTLDPVLGSTVYENRCVSQIIETLLQYKYLKRPFELEPLLLVEMPTEVETSDEMKQTASRLAQEARDRQQQEYEAALAEARELGEPLPPEPKPVPEPNPVTWHFKLRDDVYFHDASCFPDGKGRRLVAADVFYSWKRIADSTIGSKSWWLMRDSIVGFDEYRDQQLKATEGQPNQHFDYHAPVAGLKVLNDQEFEVTLKRPAARFMWILAMFQTGIVPHEAVEAYGTRFGVHPVGTGPYTLADGDWQFGLQMILHRNPNYREAYFPTEWEPEDELVLNPEEAVGKRLPILDTIRISFFEQDQPMWLHFRAEDFDYAQVPDENVPQVFSKRVVNNTKAIVLKPAWRERGVRYSPVPLLDFIFFGFNMEDELVGGFSDRATKLRQAIASALDWDERNETFYSGLNVVYDGVIPPSLEGHLGESEDSFRGPNLERARQLLKEAGYPGGKGLPVIDYYTSQGRNNREQSEMLIRQLSAVGIRLKVNLVDFPTLMQTVDDRKAAFFSFAWGSDYPDGENNLALFYGPNESPGSNHFNYKRAEYDQLYETIVGMQPSPERTKLYEQMQQMLLNDVPYLGSMARTRHYVIHRRMKYFKPVETFENWFKYVDIEE